MQSSDLAFVCQSLAELHRSPSLCTLFPYSGVQTSSDSNLYFSLSYGKWRENI